MSNFKIASVDEIKALANAAQSRFDGFQASSWVQEMTLDQAKRIRAFRVECGCTWRDVAANAHDEWDVDDDDWYPASNQLMGMALCEHAAKFFGEHYMQEPWN